MASIIYLINVVEPVDQTSLYTSPVTLQTPATKKSIEKILQL